MDETDVTGTGELTGGYPDRVTRSTAIGGHDVAGIAGHGAATIEGLGATATVDDDTRTRWGGSP